MAVPTYLCPFKQNGGTGITCENVTCGAYDATNEECLILEVVRNIGELEGKKDPATTNA